MTLYHVITAYQLLCAMTLQTIRGGESTIVISPFIKQKFPYVNKLNDYFDNIIVVEQIDYRCFHDSKETMYYFKKIVPMLDKADEIFVWGAQFSFGVCLAENEIPFVFCEEVAGMLSRPEILEHIDQKNPVKGTMYPYVKSLGLYTGEYNRATTVMCNLLAQVNGFEREGITHFNVVEELDKLSDLKKAEIISFFCDYSKISVPKDSVIIFTQHFANLRLTTFEEQALIYQIFVDYFFPMKNLIIKPHPDDLMFYSKLFPEAHIIKERFPSEFLPFLLEYQPDSVATIYSTAVYNLRGVYSNVFELDMYYEREFWKTHRYFTAMEIAKLLGKPVVCLGIYQVLMDKIGERVGVTCQFIKQVADILDKQEPITLIVDDVTGKEEIGRRNVQSYLNLAHKDTVVIFINSQNDYCWYDFGKNTLWESIIPVELKKTLCTDANCEYVYENLNSEVLYVYGKNNDLLKEVNEMQIEKHLPHVGIDVKKFPYVEGEERIKMLEGVLDATERRLLYYINLVKDLEEKIKK